MEYRFLNIFLDPKDLLTQPTNNIDPILLENNKSQVEKIYNFYKNNTNLLYINGFSGTGKTALINYSTAFLSETTLVLKYKCFNSTVLDDILLSLFLNFKKLSSQNIISEPKVKTENFTQKVNSYFAQTEKPFVIIFDSFEAILDENIQEIIDFILHLNSMQKIKIIIIGTTFENKYFNNTTLERLTTLALERNLFEKYLKLENLKPSNLTIDEFYNYTRGYYFFVALSTKIIKKQDLTLSDFLAGLKDVFLSFDKFLAQKAFTLVPPSEKNLFWLLSVARHPISIELLKKLDFYNKESLDTLINNMLVIKEDADIYVQDYFKNEVDEIAPVSSLQKIRQYLIDLYQTQLPLSPFERDICISRQTMRKEIEYHKFFLPKTPKNIENPSVDINYLSYSKVFNLNEPNKHEEKSAKEKEQSKPTKPDIDLTQRKNISINLDNLPFQNKPLNLSTDETQIVNEVELSFDEIIETIQEKEQKYDFSKIIELCQKALSMKTHPKYSEFLPFLYNKTAFAYQKLARYEKALEYYELLENYYQEKQDLKKVNLIKFNIANIFYETYKIDKAKKIFKEIIHDKESPKNLILKSYIQLANIEEDSTNQKTFEYYKKALEYIEETTDDKILSELYFKYALILDDKNDTSSAMDFYNKCISLNNDPKVNKFLSPAYSNIATLLLEKNNLEDAADNYIKAYEIDKQNDNFEGVYDSASRLASILQKNQPHKALEYLNIALEYAKNTKDIFYLISASLALGDYYYDIKKDELALKHYLKALDMAQNNLSKDNIYKINVRINDIKFKLGIEKFDNLVQIIREQNNAY